MLCLRCHHPSTDVTNSRPRKTLSLVWRRRQCRTCGYIFTTHETPVGAYAIVGPDGTVSPLSLSRLAVSIAASFPHAPARGAVAALDLAQTIATNLMTTPGGIRDQITLDDLTRTTHQVVSRFDQNAGIAYGLRHHLELSQ